MFVLEYKAFLNFCVPRYKAILEITVCKLKGDNQNVKASDNKAPSYNIKKNSSNKGSPMFECSSCVVEIVLIPDVKVIGEVDEAHAGLHKQKVKTIK